MKVLSLFSCSGGLDLGFESGFVCLKKSINKDLHPEWIKEDLGNQVKLKKTGFETVFANDINEKAKITWMTYFNKRHHDVDNIYHLESIVDLVKRAKDNPFLFPSDIEIVTGGFPCQDFSLSGKRKGFQSTKSHNGERKKEHENDIENRGTLYMWMREVISLVTPKLFIAENVKGLTTLDNAQEVIENDFRGAANCGYVIIPARVIQAADYGVPQSRERIIFYGFRKDCLNDKALKELSKREIDPKYDPYPKPTHKYSNGNNNPTLQDCVTCEDAFVGLDEPHESKDICQQQYSKAKYLSKGQGNKEIKLDGVSPTIRSEHHGNIEFRRLSLEHGGTHLAELNEGKKERRLTIRECARIQTFPDDYEFIIQDPLNHHNVTASEAYKLIGNALLCVLGYNIAMRIKENWDLYFAS